MVLGIQAVIPACAGGLFRNWVFIVRWPRAGRVPEAGAPPGGRPLVGSVAVTGDIGLVVLLVLLDYCGR